MSSSNTPSVKTFIPHTPVTFDSDLLSQLTTSTESSYARQQLSDVYIQKEVSKKLAALQAEKLKKLDSSLTKSLLEPTAKDASESVSGVNERLTSLNDKLNKLNNSKPKKAESLLKAEADVISCLKNNKDKALNCWEEVQTFKKLAKTL